MFKRYISRLEHLNKLKIGSEAHARMATFFGLSVFPDGTNAYEYELKKHDALVEQFNATKFWWMPKLKLKLTRN